MYRHSKAKIRLVQHGAAISATAKCLFLFAHYYSSVQQKVRYWHLTEAEVWTDVCVRVHSWPCNKTKLSYSRKGGNWHCTATVGRPARSASLSRLSPWDRLRIPMMHQSAKFKQNLAMYGWVIDVLTNFPGTFVQWRGPNSHIVLRVA